MIVQQGPIALSVGAGGGCLDIFTLLYRFPPLSRSLSLSLWETARYRLKYCLKGPLNPKQTTNQPTDFFLFQNLKKDMSVNVIQTSKFVEGLLTVPVHLPICQYIILASIGVIVEIFGINR